MVLPGCERLDALDYRPSAVTAVELLRSEVPAWSALVADLDADGIEELVLAGHRGAEGPGFCRLEGTIPCEWKPLIKKGKDRHHCAAGDIDADGLLDLYCTAGADHGEGAGSNEVWRHVSPMVFDLVPGALGASEVTSRGRLATFFNFNQDPWPDLLTTAWDVRSDGADNRSKLWTNLEGVFYASGVEVGKSFGARCLTAVDADDDGFVDLLGCPKGTGLTLFRNRGASALEKVAVGVDDDWYWDAQLLHTNPQNAHLLISVGGVRGKTFVEIAQLTRTLSVVKRRRISCWQQPVDEDRDVYCGRLLLHDADRDGNVDILVSRRKGFRHENMRGDAPDLLIFGPDFYTFTEVPPAIFGASADLLTSKNGVVQVNVGQSWPGSVRLLQFEHSYAVESAL